MPQSYQHPVCGIFVRYDEAAIARLELIKGGLPVEQIAIYANDNPDASTTMPSQSTHTLTDMLVDGAVGGAVGTALGALGELALVAGNITLFIASPLVAPLAMLGWGASLGAVVGAVAGSVQAGSKDGKFSDLVRDAVRSGQVVLVATTLSEEQTRGAKAVLKKTVGEYRDEARPQA